MRRDIAAELGTTARPLHPQDPGERELAARILESGSTAAADCEHVLAIFAAEARAKRTLQFLSGSMFRAPSWCRALGMSEADASRTDTRDRQSGRVTAEEPPRRIRTL